MQIRWSYLKLKPWMIPIPFQAHVRLSIRLLCRLHHSPRRVSIQGSEQINSSITFTLLMVLHSDQKGSITRKRHAKCILNPSILGREQCRERESTWEADVEAASWWVNHVSKKGLMIVNWFFCRSNSLCNHQPPHSHVHSSLPQSRSLPVLLPQRLPDHAAVLDHPREGMCTEFHSIIFYWF